MSEVDAVRKSIEQAKRLLDTDPHLANFILRDLPFLKAHDLDELSWTMHKYGCVKNDVLGLIEDIEKILAL